MAQYPQLAPQFNVQVGGGNLPAEMRGSLASVTYTEGMEGSNSVEMTDRKSVV